MKRIFHIFIILLTLTSCDKVQEKIITADRTLDLSVIFGTRAGGSGGADVEPAVNSMRVLIFYGDPAGSETTGNLLFNTFYAFGFDTAEGAGKYTVSLANPVVLPQSDCRNYNVYVVLNEEGYLLSGASPADLHQTLGDFTGTETALLDILNTPAVYSEVLKNVDEPAFLISGSKAVTFAFGELGSVKPVCIEAGSDPSTDDFNRGRSMAQIIIKEITSEPADGIDYTSSDVPLIFVKSITLENIPNAIAWSGTDGAIDGSNVTAMTAQTVGAATTHTDGSGEYYDRIWYGQVTRTISNLYAEKVQYTDAKFYRDGENADIAGAGDAGKSAMRWSFTVKPYRTTDTPAGLTPYTYEYAAGDNWKNSENVKPAESVNAVKGLEAWSKGNDVNKHTTAKLKYQLGQVFAATQDDNAEMSENITYTSYEVTATKNDGTAGDKTTIGPIQLTSEYWTVRLGDEFYVPENIQSSTTNATFLRVKLAIAQPKFSFKLPVYKKDGEIEKKKGIFTEDLESSLTNAQKEAYTPVDVSDIPAPSSLPNEETLTYTYYVGEDNTASGGANTLKTIDDVDANYIKNNGKVVYASDETNALTLPLDKNDGYQGAFRVCLDGFSRRTDETKANPITVNTSLRGSTFNWNVPAVDGADTHVYEYLIPVNNDIDSNGDYSVRRNTKYTVTLYVNQGTYNNLVTRSGSATPFTVTAKVTTEKMSDHEK